MNIADSAREAAEKRIAAHGYNGARVQTVILRNKCDIDSDHFHWENDVLSCINQLQTAKEVK